LQQAWTTAIFWLLGLADLAIAVYAFVAIPGRRRDTNLRLWLLLPDRRDGVAADAAYADHPEQPLGKTGLMYWTGIMGRSAAIPARADFLKNIAPPHFYSFAPNRLPSRSADCGLAAPRHFGASGRHRCAQILTDSLSYFLC
jgi:hypothetical protein